MSASRDVVIAVIITPTCCHQMMLVAPGVGERASAAVGVRPWGCGRGVQGSGPGLLANLRFPQRRSAVSSVTAKCICKLQ